MDGNAIKYIESFRLLAFVFGSLLLSACVSEEVRKKGATQFDKYQVSAPVLEDIEEFKQVRGSREKVTRIEIVAPKKGERLLSPRIRVSNGNDVWNRGTDYLLAEDMEPVVRNASGYLFELDPKAKKYVKIVLTVDALSELYSWKDCEPWATDVTVRFLITEVSVEGAIVTASHEERERSFSCTVFAWFPSSSGVEEALQGAFSQALITTALSRNTGEGSTTSAN